MTNNSLTTHAPIPLVDLKAQQREVQEQVNAGLAKIFENTAFIGGAAVSGFEQAYAGFLGAGHCIGVGNGTDALELALRAAGVGPGDEAIIPANTFVATAEAVSLVGATVVPVDVDPQHLLIDPLAAAEAVTERTKAIIPVHLYGQTAFVEELEPIAAACGAVIIEDAAQSQGATRFGRTAGTLGQIAGTSFYPGKNLGAAGDAGAVLTNDPELAERVRLLSAHGSRVKYVHEAVGRNSRLDAVQAVVLSAKLERLAGWNQLRREAAARYSELLADHRGVVLPQQAEGNEDVWHLYVIQVEERDRVLAELNEAGIGAGIHYPDPVHLTPAFEHLGYGAGSFPVAEQAAGRILSLPLYPHITPAQQRRVVDTLKRVL
ncbi:DegT/DnrJ/EryC1/StrS family aminotransferase [Glutamicibacter protophormiae]|uniref:DegT/DnrJ/EryC1/StrS family aminotransferase n=1 Tax=Glutamicibacter protophormiae TaxID=37930 RepID=UPI002A815BDF|nr:DegT/DnrJ/EryC1/StrS family aminotransferase [Glutamicibacter protophormiae]WPR66093.1 DegT/DnrJ/EryC1/StrS family aminotransferase [Glutamicibacter protophormiae]WPR69590.1 DegT/DnrJ/EryC1/StrS family aminotransferase [Glutamicibacter protophormiae]